MREYLEFELFELRWDYLSNSEPPYLVLKAKTNQALAIGMFASKIKKYFYLPKEPLLKGGSLYSFSIYQR